MKLKNFQNLIMQDLNLCDPYKPSIKEINENVQELENSALENKKL